ncbi:MAG: AraC family transcriptional regulator ligand-binding domain-containing protein [Pseudomonadota bacterium]
MRQATRFTVQRSWRLLMLDMGLDPAQVLRLARLPVDLFARREASLTPAQYFDLWQGLEQAAGSDALPLMIGQAISVEAFDPPVFASLCSADLNGALQRLQHYKCLIGPLVLSLDIDRQRTRVTLDCYGHEGVIPRSLGAAELVFFTQLARLATRTLIVPLDVQLSRLPDDPAPYAAYFGVPIREGAVNRIAFAAPDATRPFLTEDTAMWGFFEAGLRQQVAEVQAGASMAARVRGLLLEMLPAGQSQIEDAARRLAMSARSLQRSLGAEDARYQDVLNATRRELAEHYLARSTSSPGEIAFLLGFQDGNSFHRAFKGWTGATPGQYREAQVDRA